MSRLWAGYGRAMSRGAVKRAMGITGMRTYGHNGECTWPICRAPWAASEAPRPPETVGKAEKPLDLCFALYEHYHIVYNASWVALIRIFTC